MNTAVEEEEPEPLHAYQVTPEDASFFRKMKGKWSYGNEIEAVTLPSGRVISGAEMKRWV
ncbi:hypothetical protein E1264_03370 [Actinomadura sp. KC216]|uniref:hypothetical protein n=1 Tax=Actinomadura sp. KC216 TaxID=2530370 RepID=UPI00104DCCA0|nr:hypothetical protein [Actinomadura sp. KC216]TDB90879.1 hypothetical protein E1264_03370 [Actinomadura sp. KC216]